MRSLKIPLHWQILIAIVAGILFGVFAFPYVFLVEWIGDVFLRLLKMIAVPLIFFLIVSAVAEAGKGRNIGLLGIKTVSFYVVTTILAIITGFAFVFLFQPGVGVELGLTREIPESVAAVTPKSISQILLDIIPDNIPRAFLDQNMIAVVFVSILFGSALARLAGERGEPLRRFFKAGSELLMKITEGIILLAPYGIFAMIAARIAEMEGDSERLARLTGSLSVYVLTVFCGLALHMFVTLSVMLRLFRVRPTAHLKKMFLPIVTAFSTATSNATIPVSIKSLEEDEGVSKETASFVIPLGATINMNGTALYECVVVLFIAQAYGIEMTFAQMGIITLTVLLSAIGAAGIPMASLVMVTVVLTAVGLPLEGLGLILIVDRLLDMMRTAVNVYGDTCCAVCVAKMEGESLTIDIDAPDASPNTPPDAPMNVSLNASPDDRSETPRRTAP